MAWSLRVRGGSGQATLGGLDGATPLLELQQLVAERLGVPVDRQELLGGFPPRPIAADDAAAPLASLGIAAGDSLTDADDEDAQLAAAIAASLVDSQPSTAAPPSPPRAPAAPANGRTPAGGGPAPTSVPLPGGGGAVTRRVIPSDNSCLFTAVGYVMEHDRGRAAALRRVIADTVAADPVTYNEGFLGQENADYCAWITNTKHWGGGIELAILAAHYGRQIAAYDIQTKRVDVYGEASGYGERVMLLYDGLHYDALAVAAFEGAPEALDVTVLTVGSAEAAAAGAGADALVAACHAARQFTDVANFTLRCAVCQVGLKGEAEAVAHAKDTGHSNFAEY
ncbi:OTU2 [Scenedesmus sp. PABB004]|nr:OTU2 [Scenedesmus sp. PABB004]